MTSKPTIAIIHGFAEGPAHSKRLRRHLETQGFRVIQSHQQADVIIAHSGGMFLLPTNLTGKAVILSAPPIGRQRSMPRSMLQKITTDAGHARRQQSLGKWFVKSSWNTWYIVTKLPDIQRMLRGMRAYPAQPPLDSARRVLVISHSGDPWSGDVGKDQIMQRDYSFISHSGIHDHIWENPQEYVTIIQYLYES